ncbi:MAG TPA: DUF255 domain-containing protein, partial [Saprospiraceae bacterium]|nr:DUF255 domain-containing protein [Saprospiraceae bacterium]
ALMNEHFINIKVDREERPDVDAIYMDACQIVTGGGGWPLNCFLTPEGKPFYAGTYFPPRPAYGRPSWPQLLLHLSQIWAEKRDVALEQAERLTGHIRKNDDVLVDGIAPETASTHDPASIYLRMREQFDQEAGGFGGAPKFPSTMAIQFLLNFHAHSGHGEALEHALFSLEQMIHGGIYDQLGGGFARYATDKAWLVPHFEKMLYDNALLVGVLADAYKIICADAAPHEAADVQKQRRAALFRETIEETLSFIEREMTSPEGGFYSALDADSEGEEGKYYVWQRQEIEQVLGGEAHTFCTFYDVTQHGNWEEKNILHRPRSFETFAADTHQGVDVLKQRLAGSRAILLGERQRRVAPGLDHKVLLSWNALMASAYAAAYTALRHEPYRQAAVRNVDLLLSQFTRPAPDGTQSLPLLRHSLSQPDAFLDDYAYLI